MNLLTVSNVDGTLTAVGVASGKNYHYVQITIDGTQVVSDLLVGSNALVTAANGGLGVALPFSRSLRVDIRDSPASPLTSYWAAYVTSHTEPYGKPEIYVDKHENQQFRRELAAFGTAENQYTVDTLLGPLYRSEVQLSGDYYLRDEQIQGTVLLYRDQGPSESREPMSAEVTLRVRPYGYSRTLDEFQVGLVEGEREFVYDPGNDRIQTGAFEIVAALPEYMNIPAVFFRK
ncbi:hypothetical protein [Streptomyces sp. NBC_01367]|uniref:hypothetical protein n=1 Tax=Streptomyces sp. NBC_01367 TaxID=2903841 RepID=UPI003255E59E